MMTIDVTADYVPYSFAMSGIDPTTALIQKSMDRESLFRLSYVPFVIGELVWDYLDSIRDECIRMRVQGTKDLVRRLPKFREKYNSYRDKFIDAEKIKREHENMEVFEECVRDITSQMQANVQFDIASEYPNLTDEWKYFLTGVAQCEILLNALIVYTTKQETLAAKRMQKDTINRILPPPILILTKMVPLFYGDKPLSKKFAELKRQYIKSYASQMTLIEFNDSEESKSA